MKCPAAMEHNFSTAMAFRSFLFGVALEHVVDEQWRHH